MIFYSDIMGTDHKKKGGIFMFARDYRRIAREKLSGKWAAAIGAALLAALLGGAIAGSNISLNLRINESTLRYLDPAVLAVIMKVIAVGSILGLVQFVIGGVVRQGYCAFLLEQQEGGKPRVKALFSQFNRFGDGFVLALLEGLYVMLWCLLFLIPGIIAAYSYAMAPFILAEHPGMRASEAIRASKEMMKGRKWKLFCLQFSFIGWSFLSLLTLGIGGLWLVPYMDAATAAFYREASKVQ